MSGGEPLMQHRFVVKLFAAAKAMGIHTALDTNGYFGDRLSDAELEHIDLVMLELKTWDAERHHRPHRHGHRARRSRSRAGSRREASRSGFASCWCPGLTDDPDDVAQIAQFAAELGNVERVDVLPFHQMGRYKWEKLGLDYTLENTASPSNELVEQTCALFRSAGLKAY